MKITVQMLRNAGACREQIEVFEREWGRGGNVTLERCLRAAALHLDFDWASKRFLRAPAEEAFRKAIDQAKEAYRKAIAPAKEAYQKAIAWAFWKAVCLNEER